jgi:hypothetical protein
MASALVDGSAPSTGSGHSDRRPWRWREARHRASSTNGRSVMVALVAGVVLATGTVEGADARLRMWLSPEGSRGSLACFLSRGSLACYLSRGASTAR